MKLETILLDKKDSVVTITFHQPELNNPITKKNLEELHMVLNVLEKQQDCNVIILKGNKNHFCTGMDLNELVTAENKEGTEDIFAKMYQKTLEKLSKIPKVVIANVEGKAMAGGVGFVAASDIVIAGQNANFSLSEALWGMLPAIVLPFLVRRVGFQKAYTMTISTMTINAKEAYRIHLADEISENTEDLVQHYVSRLKKLNINTIRKIKEYFMPFTGINDAILERAVETTAGLVKDEEVRTNIENYVKYKMFSWDKR